MEAENSANVSSANPAWRASSASVRRSHGRPRLEEIQKGLKHPDEPTILSDEGSQEVMDEILNGSPLTPERRATFERMRSMAGVRTRKLPPRVPSGQQPMRFDLMEF
jgi:hypothetical protein